MLSYLYDFFLKGYITVKYQNDEFIVITPREMKYRIHKQQGKMPDFLSFGIKIVTALFIVHVFCTQLFSINIDLHHISNARKSRFLPFRYLIRFYDSLFEVANVKEDLVQNYQKAPTILTQKKFDFVIIGSGPGGAIAANKLREAGFNTCLLETGRIYKNKRILPFSYNEMLHQYKHAGITTTLGNANITYVEGATFGGGSEINSGLYHRTPKDILSLWKTKYGLIDSEPEKLEKHYKLIEKELCISYSPTDQISKASLFLEDGANKLGWKVQEIPRWFKYKQSQSDSGIKMTMTKTYLKDYIDNGGVVYELCKANALKKYNGEWNVLFNTINCEKDISAKNIILSAGTIGTPQLLRRSGISRLAGKRFQMHPTIKIVALFDEKVNHEEIDVPVHQVKEFAPDFSFGCSISSKPYLRVAMLDHPNQMGIVEQKWQYMAIYYAMITPEGNGSIKHLPFFKDPLITYRLTVHDKENLAVGLKKLSQLLISSGAKILYPSIKDGPIISNINDINQLPDIINPANTSLMTVHLFSSCPIGEKKDICVANSFGKVFDHDGLFISDGSMLPTAPGVNPQGTIMAFAHRNIERIISEV